MINLFFNCWDNPTGAGTFVEHLYKMFIEAGQEVRLCAVKANPGKPKPVHTYSKIMVEQVSIEEAMEMNKQPSLLAHYMRGGEEEELCLKLVEAGCPFVIHDPRGAKEKFVRAAEDSGASIVMIRAAMQDLFRSKYPSVSNNVFLRHPYIPAGTNLPYGRKHHAVAISRIAWEKNTNIICQANDILPPWQQIDIFGVISDRLYSYFELDKKYPKWRRNYFKAPQSIGIDTFTLCQNSEFAIDLSTFKGEGGGSQYCFFEAMEADSCLVLHDEWVQYPGEMKAGYNCVTVRDAEELSRVLQEPIPTLPGYAETLAMHSTEEVKEEWLQIFR